MKHIVRHYSIYVHYQYANQNVERKLERENFQEQIVRFCKNTASNRATHLAVGQSKKNAETDTEEPNAETDTEEPNCFWSCGPQDDPGSPAVQRTTENLLSDLISSNLPACLAAGRPLDAPKCNFRQLAQPKSALAYGFPIWPSR